MKSDNNSKKVSAASSSVYFLAIGAFTIWHGFAEPFGGWWFYLPFFIGGGMVVIGIAELVKKKA